VRLPVGEMMNAISNKSHCLAEYALFDLDGTLVETDYANLLAYKDAIKEVLGQSIAINCNRNCRFNKHELAKYFPALTAFEYRRIIKIKNRLSIKYLSHTHLIAHVAKQLISLSQTKTIVVVTNAQRHRAQLTLSYHGLDKYIDVMFCSDERGAQANKYQHALTRLTAATENVFLFENEEQEIMNACIAGISTSSIQKV
jgi:beta-phosphoglucomutase-like phosphatase (HAD superfamily)